MVCLQSKSPLERKKWDCMGIDDFLESVPKEYFQKTPLSDRICQKKFFTKVKMLVKSVEIDSKSTFALSKLSLACVVCSERAWIA